MKLTASLHFIKLKAFFQCADLTIRRFTTHKDKFGGLHIDLTKRTLSDINSMPKLKGNLVHWRT